MLWVFIGIASMCTHNGHFHTEIKKYINLLSKTSNKKTEMFGLTRKQYELHHTEYI